MNIHQESQYSNQQSDVKVIPLQDLYHSYQLLTEQTSKCCRQLKLIIFQQMRLNSISDLQIQCQYDIGIQNIKEVIQLINRDLIKLKSLLKICFAKKSNTSNEDQNQQRILKTCMMAKQMCLFLKEAEQHIEQDQNEFIISNLCSMFKILNETIFSYQSNNNENQQIINQIFKKIPKLNQQIWMKKSYKHPVSYTNGNDAERFQKYQYETELLRRQYAIKNQRFQEQLLNLARQNAVLEESLRIKVQENQRNEAEFIIYLKKYNCYIEKQKQEIDELMHQIQILEEDSKYKNQKDFYLFRQIGEIKQKLKKTKQVNKPRHQEFNILEKTSKTTKGLSTTYASSRKPIIRN